MARAASSCNAFAIAAFASSDYFGHLVLGRMMTVGRSYILQTALFGHAVAERRHAKSISEV